MINFRGEIKVKRSLFILVAIFVQILALSATPKNILFVGNSITYCNDMPQVFEQIADSKATCSDDSVTVTMYAPGGTGFVNHVESPAFYEHIRAGIWDYIVLQPGSQESPGYSFPIEETLGRCQIMLDSIYTYNPCVQVLFYEISYGVWGNSLENLETYNETMDLILTNLQFLADETELFFAPVGQAFHTSWNNDLDNMLWMGNGDIHPNAKGSYLASCVFYNSVFQKPSSGIEVYATLEEEDALYFQTLADSVTLNHLPDWRINTYNKFLDFALVQQDNRITLENLSQNITDFEWYFGDGNSSSEQSPLYDYQATGDFTVTLSADFGHENPEGCYHSKSMNVTIEEIITETDFVEIPFITNFSVYPNPFNPATTISFNLSAETKDIPKVSIYNIKGQKIFTLSDPALLDCIEGRQGSTKSITWNGRNQSGKQVSSGIYFVKLDQGNTSAIKKVILMK